MSIKVMLPALKQEVEVRGLKVKEIDILTDKKKIQSGDAINQILRECVLDPKDLNTDTLFEADRNMLFIGIRRATFGDIYEFRIKSPYDPNGKPQEFDIDLSQIEISHGDQDLVRKQIEDKNATFSYPLGETGLSLKYRFITGEDHKMLIRMLKGVDKASANLLLKIKGVEGWEDDTKKIPLKTFIKDMDYCDIAEFNDFYEEKAPYIDDKIILECMETGEEFETRLQIDIENFFKRSSRKKRS